MHFFGYRPCVPGTGNFDSKENGSQIQPNGVDPRAIDPENGVPSRLVFLNGSDEYRVTWDAEHLPQSYEIFVDGSDKRGVIEISRKQNGSLSVAARALTSEKPLRDNRKREGDAPGSVWAVRARENSRWEPSACRNEVRIDLSRDSGRTWEPLFGEAPTGGPETWSITGPMGPSCRIRLRTAG